MFEQFDFEQFDCENDDLLDEGEEEQREKRNHEGKHKNKPRGSLGKAKSRREEDLELLENASRQDIGNFDKKLFSGQPPWFRVLTDLHRLMSSSDDILLFSYALNVSGMHAGGEPNSVKAGRRKAEEGGYEYRKKPRWKGAWFRFTVDRVQSATGFKDDKQTRVLNRLKKNGWLFYRRKGPGGLRHVLINYHKLSRRLEKLQQARWEA